MVEGARALALMRGRRYVLTEDMTDLIHDVLRHRLSLTYEALSDGVTADAILSRIIGKVAAPLKPLQSSDEEQKAA
jgi:MoxR-like ATPase